MRLETQGYNNYYEFFSELVKGQIMELVKTGSEEALADFLAQIEKSPNMWLSAHVNMSRITEQLLEKETLSRKTLDNIQQSSQRIATLLMNSEISKFEGKIFVFQDSDVLALFKREEGHPAPTLEKLKQEFAASGMIDFLSINTMQEQLENLVQITIQKRENAAVFFQRHRAVEVAETIFTDKKADPELTRSILKKRHNRIKKTILVIEDDIVARGMVALALRDTYDVIQAKDAIHGIAAYIDKAPDTVFLDIHLPDRTGHEVLECLRLLEPKAYVVMLSSDSITDNVLSARTHGAAGFVRKPFLKEDLLRYAKHSAA